MNRKQREDLERYRQLANPEPGLKGGLHPQQRRHMERLEWLDSAERATDERDRRWREDGA